VQCPGSSNPDCVCFMTTEGESRCINGATNNCSSNPAGDCVTSADCPAGQFCFAVPGCCPAPLGQTLCASPCS
jgi:hypothetical protein